MRLPTIPEPPTTEAQSLGQESSTPDASRFLASIVEHSDDAIITKDLNGVITSWNKGAQRLFGYTPEEAIGQAVSMLIPQDRKNEEPEILARLRRGSRVDHYETIRRRKDGTHIHISLTVSPVRDAAGRIIGASKIARDISEIQRARATLARSHEELERLVSERTASLQQAVAQMEEFSYTVSHDLRAPVRAMKGFAQAALEDNAHQLDEKGRRYLQNILAGGTRMEQLIQDVLTYSKTARVEAKTAPVSLQKVVQEIIQTYPELRHLNAEIIIRSPLHNVMAHEVSLIQALSNLLSNAVKFVPPGTRPRVEIGTELHNGSVRVWIQDNGMGINPKYQHRLFNIFQRVHKVGGYEGTGIGLAIVRKAAEKMGGTVGVESDGVNGSRFWIDLPAVTN